MLRSVITMFEALGHRITCTGIERSCLLWGWAAAASWLSLYCTEQYNMGDPNSKRTKRLLFAALNAREVERMRGVLGASRELINSRDEMVRSLIHVTLTPSITHIMGKCICVGGQAHCNCGSYW